MINDRKPIKLDFKNGKADITDISRGDIAHALRCETGLSQQQLADELGINQSTLAVTELYRTNNPTKIKVYDKLMGYMGYEVRTYLVKVKKTKK